MWDDMLREAKGFLVDLDGTLVTGDAPLPWAHDLVDHMGDAGLILSNDAQHTPAELARLLAGLGLPIPEERILLAGVLALDHLAREAPGARVMLLAGNGLAAHARSKGLRLVQERPDVVVIGRDLDFSYARLTAAVNAVRDGARLVAANPDRTRPGPGGTVLPETGALLAAVLAATGPVPHLVIGKPEPFMFAEGLRRIGTRADETIMIGDNPETDGRGAARAGLRFLDVRHAPGHKEMTSRFVRQQEAKQGQERVRA
ncbi:haloacid dehalogenase [Azorhizobium oxalatiphilum]|uniref:Haloacid dehalogenase n=2 Tax=Azorhizobium oxalatiphilum TaxID=980631 RepID=A0A917BRX0_9HYPH|nr:haloacid dehalogenase [Azorhizobium oxalatiphilum]